MSLKAFSIKRNEAPTGSFWDQHLKLLLLIFFFLFSLAGAARLHNYKAPGVLPERDFGSAILARDYFYRTTNLVPDWEKSVSRATLKNIPILEPPVTEFMASVLYRFAGSEQIWLARLMTSTFWLIGGFFLYKIAKMYLSIEAAIVSTAFYLFAPLGILVSRSFQPDALMMLLFLVSLYSTLKYYEKPSKQRLTGSYWPRRFTYPFYLSSYGRQEQSVQDRLNDLGFVPEYFIVTDFNQFKKHHSDLREYIVSNCSSYTESAEYMVYSQCTPPTPNNQSVTTGD